MKGNLCSRKHDTTRSEPIVNFSFVRSEAIFKMTLAPEAEREREREREREGGAVKSALAELLLA